MLFLCVCVCVGVCFAHTRLPQECTRLLHADDTKETLDGCFDINVSTQFDVRAIQPRHSMPSLQSNRTFLALLSLSMIYSR
jgi:hypothetical protein